MAKVVHWSIIHGDDAFDGTAETWEGGTVGPVRTWTRANALAVNGDIILLDRGIYPTSVLAGTGSVTISKTIQLRGKQRGLPIFDFEGTLPTTQHITMTVSAQIRGIEMRNMGAGKYAVGRTGGTPVVIDCVIRQRDGAANTGRGILGNATATKIEGCTFYNLEMGINGAEAYRNLLVACTTPFSGTNTRDYNAFPGNAEPNGINTTTSPPPDFLDVPGGDFRLDLSDPGDAVAYRTGGQFGGRIGAPGFPGPWWDARFPQSRWMTPDPAPVSGMVGSWQNDASYEDAGGPSTTGEIVEDVGDFEPIIDLAANEDAATGQIISAVIDWGTRPVTMNDWPMQIFEDVPSGAIISHRWYRQRSTVFLLDDDEIDGPAWVEFDPEDQLDLTDRYQQLRARFQAGS